MSACTAVPPWPGQQQRPHSSPVTLLLACRHPLPPHCPAPGPRPRPQEVRITGATVFVNPYKELLEAEAAQEAAKRKQVRARARCCVALWVCSGRESFIDAAAACTDVTSGGEGAAGLFGGRQGGAVVEQPGGSGSAGRWRRRGAQRGAVSGGGGDGGGDGGGGGCGGATSGQEGQGWRRRRRVRQFRRLVTAVGDP